MRFRYRNTHYFLEPPVPLWEEPFFFFNICLMFAISQVIIKWFPFTSKDNFSAMRFSLSEVGADIHCCGVTTATRLCTGTASRACHPHPEVRAPSLQTLVKKTKKQQKKNQKNPKKQKKHYHQKYDENQESSLWWFMESPPSFPGLIICDYDFFTLTLLGNRSSNQLLF